MDKKTASPSRDFIYTIPSKVLFDDSITDLDRKIYMIIRSFMDTTGDCYPSNGWFAEKFKINKRTVPSSINRLVEAGHIKRIDHESKRYLIINYSPCIDFTDDPMIVGSPPHDPEITPPMIVGSPNTSSNIINSKMIAAPHVDNFRKAKEEAVTHPDNVRAFQDKFSNKDVAIEELYDVAVKKLTKGESPISKHAFYKFIVNEYATNWRNKASQSFSNQRSNKNQTSYEERMKAQEMYSMKKYQETLQVSANNKKQNSG